MKKLLGLISFLFLFPIVNANEHVKISYNKNYEYHDHETYEVWYDVEYHNPAVVIWDLTFEDAIQSEAVNDTRASKFTKCTNTVSSQVYTKTGYDRGHMCPNNDRDWSKESSENTFRMCNVTPQTATLNRGRWKRWEEMGHELAKKHMLVTIVCGPIYLNDLKSEIWISDNDVPKVRVPDSFFKIFIVNNKIDSCWLFDQSGIQPKSVNIKEIEKQTGITFEVGYK